MLEGMVWVVAHAETNAVSVERIREYTEVEQEADWSSDQTPDRYSLHCSCVILICVWSTYYFISKYIQSLDAARDRLDGQDHNEQICISILTDFLVNI